MPFKRGAIEAPIRYLDRTELDGLLKSIDRSRHLGRRDYALFALMFNTGARVQEVLDVRVGDVRLEAPAQVRLMGKGRKVRVCPLWPATARLLRDLIAEHPAGEYSPLHILQKSRFSHIWRAPHIWRNVEFFDMRCSRFLCTILLVSIRPVKKYAKNLPKVLWPTTPPEMHFRNSAMYPVHSRPLNRNSLELHVS
jgi:hypothetical protein